MKESSPAESSRADSVSIVIPVFNQLEFTQRCVTSLLKNTNEGCKIVVVDNDSTDGTPEYLATLPQLTVIRNDENVGCAPAWNQGVVAVSAAPDDWVCVLNNDVILPPGWLNGLLSAAAEHGLDIVSPAFREGPVNYDLEPYAAEFVSVASEALRPGIAHGICFMVRQWVFEKIGMFDENFWLGLCEDSDFFYRAQRAGFLLGVTGRSFLHHFGSVTQDAIRKSGKTLPYEARNRAYYRKKWNLTWTRRRAIRFRDKAQLAWWRLREFNGCGHTLCEKWQHGKLIYE